MSAQAPGELWRDPTAQPLLLLDSGAVVVPEVGPPVVPLALVDPEVDVAPLAVVVPLVVPVPVDAAVPEAEVPEVALPLAAPEPPAGFVKVQ